MRLQQDLAEYLKLRRALGDKLRGAEGILGGYVDHLDRLGYVRVTTSTALEWASTAAPGQASGSRRRTARRFQFVRDFAAYLHALDPRHEVPPREVFPWTPSRIPPYLFTAEEVRVLIQAARALPTDHGPPGRVLRGETFATIIGLLAATGLRRGEVLALDRADVDFEAGVLRIRYGKFGKSRLVPVHPSVGGALHRYARDRDRVFPMPTSPAFFLSTLGRRISSNLGHTFTKLVRAVGIRAPGSRRQPRLHDLRHRFAVETLLNWYRQGLDAERHLLTLSTYLGHVNLSGTYWYLQAHPELLRYAADRVRCQEGGR